MKKRKTTKGTDTRVESWPRLCAGAEPPTLVKLRESTFRKLWDQHEQSAQEIANHVDGRLLIDVLKYVNANEAPAGRLRIALVVSGPNHNGQKHLLGQLQANTEYSNNITIQLQARQSPNLQSALRHVIRDAIEQHSGQEGYASFLASQKRLIPMNFDLELLEKYVREKDLGKIIICFQDVETFDAGVLSEVLSTLTSWTDRISFVALLVVATTIELFESRLSKSVIRLLDTTAFDFSPKGDPLYEAFCSVQCNPGTKLYLGDLPVKYLFDLTQYQIASTSSFVHALKYIHMTHFFANPLSALLDRPLSADIVSLCESIRNTPSFQTHCEALLSQRKSPTETVRQLLTDDDFLLTQAQSAVLTGIDTLRHINERVQHLVTLYQYLHPKDVSALQLHAQLLNSLPSINESPAYETLIERLKLIKSDDLITLMFAHQSILPNIAGQSLSQLTTAVSKLHTKHSVSAISSVYSSQTLSATTKVSNHSSADREYTKILDDLLGKLATYFSPPPSPSSASIFVDPSTLFMNEAFLFTTRSPLSSTFVPRPRFAIERALSRPSDYLGCECCNDPTSLHYNSAKGNNEREATSVLYNLVNEAGREINVRDLWDTFRQVLSPTEQDVDVDVDSEEEDDRANGEEEEKHLLALFYQALANVKMLGLIKSSSASGTGANKKAVDVISRTTWKEL